MSFSKEVKEELSRQFSTARHCQIAEIAAIVSMCGQINLEEKQNCFLKIHTENLTVARKYFTLVKKTFCINCEILIKQSYYLKKNRVYILIVKDVKASLKILNTIKALDKFTRNKENIWLVNFLIIQNTCCKRAFLRGVFLACGSINNPAKAYHFEIVTTSKEKAEQLCKIIYAFHVEAKIVLRKKYYVVYVKEGSQIVDLLNVMEAHIALMKFENIRILKEMRNSINRQVNCETANINKTVIAASKQMESIFYIRNSIGLGELPKGLEEIARLRIEQPEASLKELGAMLNSPIGKSGVNHRLRKISAIADSLREQKEEKKNGIKENNN